MCRINNCQINVFNILRISDFIYDQDLEVDHPKLKHLCLAPKSINEIFAFT